jgi:hypothetical protein
MTAGTYALAVPTGNVSANCAQIGGSGKYKLTISVTARGTVPRANDYVLRLVSPSGAVTDIDFSGGNLSYDSGSNTSVARGTWKYSVEAQYKVPDTTNVWSSAATPQIINC